MTPIMNKMTLDKIITAKRTKCPNDRNFTNAFLSIMRKKSDGYGEKKGR